MYTVTKLLEMIFLRNNILSTSNESKYPTDKLYLEYRRRYSFEDKEINLIVPNASSVNLKSRRLIRRRMRDKTRTFINRLHFRKLNRQISSLIHQTNQVATILFSF